METTSFLNCRIPWDRAILLRVPSTECKRVRTERSSPSPKHLKDVGTPPLPRVCSWSTWRLSCLPRRAAHARDGRGGELCKEGRHQGQTKGSRWATLNPRGSTPAHPRSAEAGLHRTEGRLVALAASLLCRVQTDHGKRKEPLLNRQ